MGNSQILVICALVLLGFFTLTANSLMANNATLSEQSEYVITAFSLAQSVIDEAKSKAFDQLAIGTPITSPLSLTAPVSLGAESGEAIHGPDSSSVRAYKSTKQFNDVDDYNGYARLVNSPRADGYQINVTVCYASPTCPDSMLATRTFCKRMTVTVTSPYLSSPVSLQYAFFF